MKATGIVRKVDELGRIVLPIELRHMFDIAEKDPLEIFVEADEIILHKYKPGCELCGNATDLIVVGGHRVCRDCARNIAEALEAIGNGAT